MIEVMYAVRKDEKFPAFTISVNGHAGYAETGKDIVCAAASILLFTLLDRLSDVCDDFNYSVEKGDAIVTAYGRQAIETFEVIACGYRILQKNYPEYITVQEG